MGRPVEYTLPLLNKAECDVPWRIWLKEKSGKDCGISVNPMHSVKKKVQTKMNKMAWL